MEILTDEEEEKINARRRELFKKCKEENPDKHTTLISRSREKMINGVD